MSRIVFAVALLAAVSTQASAQAGIHIQPKDTVTINSLIAPSDSVLKISGSRYVCVKPGVSRIVTVTQMRNKAGRLLRADTIMVACGNLGCDQILTLGNASADTTIGAAFDAMLKASNCGDFMQQAARRKKPL